MSARLLLPAVLVALSAGLLPAQTISVDRTSLNFFYQTTTGVTPPQQNIQVTVPGGGTAQVDFTPKGTWLFVLNPAGTGQFNVGVIVTGALTPNTYTGTITITVPGTSIPTVTIPVTLLVSNQPLLSPGVPNLTFTASLNGPVPAAQSVLINSTSPVTFLAAAETNFGNWLNVTPPQGTTPAQLSVTVATAGLTVGTYDGAIRVDSPTAGNAPMRIPVRLVVVDQISLAATPATLQFDFQTGGARPPDQIVSITTSGLNVPWTATVATNPAGQTWLTTSTLSGTSPSNLVVTANPTGLAVGTYTGTITINATGASNNPQTVTVTLRVSADPLVRATPSGLSFTYQLNGPAVPPQNLVLTNSGPALSTTITATNAPWLTITPITGSTPLTAVVGVNPTNLVAGTYTGSISVQATGAGNSLTIPVSLLVTTTPQPRVTPNQLSFYYQVGQATAPLAQKVSVASTGTPLTMNATVANTGVSWLTVSPASGATPIDFNVSINPAGLAAGVYTGNVTVQSTDAGSVPITVPVRLQVDANPLMTSNVPVLEFSYSVGGATPPNQTISLASTGAAIPYTVTSTTANPGNWLLFAPDTGSTPGSISVGVNVLGLAQGTYTGVLTVNSAGAANSPLYIPVVLRVIQQTDLVVVTDRITFTQIIGGQAPAPRLITVKSSTGVPIRYDVTVSTFTAAGWLSTDSTAGLTESSFNIRVNPANLVAGNYDGEVVVTSSGATNSPRRIPVTLVVTPPLPTLIADKNPIAFSVQSGAAAPSPQAVQITSSGAAAPISVTTQSQGGQWLFVSTSSATTPATLNLTVNPAGLAVGNYTGTVTVASTGAANSPLTINVTLAVTAAVNPPVVTSITNGASFQPGPISPGMLITLKGTGLGPAQLTGTTLTPQGLVNTTIAGVRVLFDNIPAPLYYAWNLQTTAIVPYEVRGRSTVQMVVDVNGVRSAPVQLTVAETAPGVFVAGENGVGHVAAAAVIGPGQIDFINAQNPARRGQEIYFYMTGEGQTNPAGVTGQIATGAKIPLQEVKAKVAGIDAEVVYYGTAAGIVSGVIQVNLRVPNPTDPALVARLTGLVPLEITVGNTPAQSGVVLAIRQ